MRYIGVDLHKSSFTTCILEGGRKEKSQYKISNIDDFKKRLQQDDVVAVEMLGYTRHFAKQIKDKARIVAVNTTEFKVISHSNKKTDVRDAENLALYLEKGLLPTVKIPSDNIAEIRSLTNTRQKLVDMRTTLKNKMHAILNSYGIMTKHEDFTGKKGLDRVTQYQINPAANIELEVIVEQIKKLNEGIEKLSNEIKSRGTELKGFKNITSIKGIGESSGTILLSAIGDINDFEDSKKLASYFGIVPRVRQSSDTVRQGSITKQGNKLARTTLVQCTLIAIRYSPYLKAFYEKLKHKKGSGKAIIATAKKLLNIIYDTLKNDWEFVDFPNYKLKQV